MPAYRAYAGCLAAALLAWPASGDSPPPSQAEPAPRPVTVELEDPELWSLLGSFRGTTSSRLMQEVNDLLFEMENDGDLYEDLGDLTIGLGTDTSDDDVKLSVDWDNSFRRRVEPRHRELAPGQTVTAADLSRYVDVQSIVSRGRLGLGAAERIVGDQLGLATSAEGGTSLTLYRVRRPLVYADRELADVLAERGLDDYQELLPDKPRLAERSLVAMAAEGVAAIGRGLARAVGRTADTERGVIFYQNAADPVTLMLDVGVPVPPELFLAGDQRLSVGDQVRHATFLGISPLIVGLRETGLEARYESFVRILRETVVLKDEDNHVQVRVRDSLMRGHELVPLKVRPRIRVLGIIKVGYTFFDQRWDRARSSSSEVIYRFDLDDATDLASFRRLLELGTGVRLRSREARAIPAGAEVLDTAGRSGDRRSRRLKVRFFSPFRYRDQKSAISELVRSGAEEPVREISVARSRELRKRFGRRRDWRRRLLVRSWGELEGAGGSLDSDRSARVELLNSLRDGRADAEQLQRIARILRLTFGPHPVLDELAAESPAETTRFFVNVRLRFGREHLLHFLGLGEDELWFELGEVLLGQGYGEAWATEPARRRFRRRQGRRVYEASLGPRLDELPNPYFRRRTPSLRTRYRLAKRAVRRFHSLQELIRDSECLSCLSRSLRSWQDLELLQVLMYRLSRTPELPAAGYHYEVFTDRMLRPFTVSGGSLEQAGSAQYAATEELRNIDRRGYDWLGAKSSLEGSNPRLRAGNLYRARGEGDGTCWKLRLYSDLRYAEGIQLRVDLRRSRGGLRSDETIYHSLLELGRPTAVIETPFMTARYFYDVPLTAVSELRPETAYTLLLRLLEPGGLPVSEEQQLRFEWPAGDAPAACRGGAQHIAAAGARE